MSRVAHDVALQRTDVMALLAPYDPHVAGTPPLGLDLPGSDIDIVCEVRDFDAFAALLTEHFGDRPDFAVHARADLDAMIVRFRAWDWPFEISARPCRSRSNMAGAISVSSDACSIWAALIWRRRSWPCAIAA